MVNPKACVEKIRREIEESRNSRLWEDSINMLSTVSESIFSRSAHFILELLQNAEDACSRIRQSQGHIRLRISPNRITVSHNGASFNEADVSAICGVRSNKKPEEGTLGYLGIGFKSVFKVSDCPQIHSDGFHFKFDKTACEDPPKEPWQITPIWIDGAHDTDSVAPTTFMLPFRSPELYEQTREELEKLGVHIFLFLRWLKTLEVVEESTGGTTVIENLGERDRTVTLRKNNERYRFVIFRRTADVPQHVADDPALEFYRRQRVRQREVVLAFGVDREGNLDPIEDASTLGSVSSFLPLVEERSGAKFLIQSDFLVQPGREAIQYELSWNQWLVREAAEVAKEAVEEFKQHPVWKRQFLPVFDFTSYRGQPAFDKLFSPNLQEPLTSYLQTAAVYPTASGSYVSPDKAVQPDERLTGLLTDADLELLFGRGVDLHLADPELDPKAIPDSIRGLVKQVTPGQVARNKALLDKKASQNEAGWFAKLYMAMAESGQQFKTVESRDRRGRIVWADSPVYVLTDKGNIVSAKSVHLREIPKEVLELGTNRNFRY